MSEHDDDMTPVVETSAEKVPESPRDLSDSERDRLSELTATLSGQGWAVPGGWF